MQEKDFWNDTNKAQEITQLSKRIKEKINNHKALVRRIEDVEVLKDMMEEDDMETANEIIAEINDIDKIINTLRIETLLSGEYDKNNAIVTLHTGVGGTDANDWTSMLLRMYTRWCEKKAMKWKL